MTDTSKTRSANHELTAGDLRDHFLIAMPGMHDTSFAHSVTYICDHNESGAMGLTLNHPLPLTLADIFQQLDLEYRSGQGDQPVMSGGPVQIERGFVLHNAGSEWQSTLQVSSEISLTASRDILAALAEGEGPSEHLMALGYAGWDAGQLEEEIAANAWLTLPADKQILFNTPPEQRWSAAARHLGIDLNLISANAGHA